MKYHIFQNNPASQFIQISLTIRCQTQETVRLQLPAWRAGRYEIANYAQYIRRVIVLRNDITVPHVKVTKDLWLFTAEKEGDYEISYQFFARQMDAGGSWSDPYQLYLNFINFAFEIKSREQESIWVSLNLPDNFQVATALPGVDKFHFRAHDFQHLVDSPLIASPDLKHFAYQVMGVTFHLWIQGEVVFDVQQVLHTYEAFTKRQIQAFGNFPAKDYHFLFQLLPYTHYHGVEHQFSTVITFGPASSLSNPENLDSLIGVSSHELYHFWNVCRIRPLELLPFDFSKETYTNAGVVAEGVTTYFGDIYLLRSGHFTLEKYLSKLAKMINREFESLGWENQSIAESSLDLWLDGYKAGIPEKKVSIYNRGALISLCLDLILLNEGSSLEAVMREMWNKFGQLTQGYTLEDFKQIICKKVKDGFYVEEFFNSFIYGTSDLLPPLIDLLNSIGIRLESVPRQNNLESIFGMLITSENTLAKIHPACPAYRILMIGDIVTDVIPDENGITLQINRHGKLLNFNLPNTGSVYYTNYNLIINDGDFELRDLWMT
jgi:predicted metalloprotease with PDZ domain